jgi:hypothetical protein
MGCVVSVDDDAILDKHIQMILIFPREHVVSDSATSKIQVSTHTNSRT